jgi:L-threonylcarbamoyladenylate synthase
MRRVAVDPGRPDPEVIQSAAAWVRAGGLVVYPTDTFYGLAADPFSDCAVADLFDAKGRDERVAIPIIAADVPAVEARATGWTPLVSALARRFWPGPLSLVLEAPSGLAAAVHAGLGTVAVRVPNHPVARALAAAAGGFVTATSANRSGQPSVQAVGDLDAIAVDPRVLVVDAGPTPGGAPSTIVDVRTGTPHLIREGAIRWADVLAAAEHD